MNGFSPLPPQTNGQPASETIYTNGIHPYPGNPPCRTSGGLCHIPSGLGTCARLTRQAPGVLPTPGTRWMNQPCTDPHRNPSSCGIAAFVSRGMDALGFNERAGSSSAPLRRCLAASSLLWELLIPRFLLLILSSFSLLFSSQLKAPRWQIPSSKPTQACSTMQVSNFALHFFPLSPLCSSPLFLGGERHLGVEPQDWGSVLGHGLMW